MKKIEEKFLDLTEIQPFISQCYAHLKDEKRETVLEHTKLCQSYFVKVVEQKNIWEIIEKFEKEYFSWKDRKYLELFESMAVNIITFHDIGKINPKFQREKMKHCWHRELEPDANLHSRHSIISSVIYLDYFLNEIKKIEDKEIKNILKDLAYIHSFLIAEHHNRIDQFIEYVEAYSEDYKPGWYAKDWVNRWKQEINKDRSEMFLSTSKVTKNIKARLQKNSIKNQIFLYAYTRLLYSLLVTCDYYATSEFMNNIAMKDFGQIFDWQDIFDTYKSTELYKNIRRYEKEKYPLKREKLEHETDINVLRTELFLDVEKALQKNIENFLFYLEAPTGSGKSNIALNLSLKMAEYDSRLRKIFYIYPYNTLVEQNMACIEKIFGNNPNIMSKLAVVNSLVEMKETENEYKEEEEKKYHKILLDRQFLNYPIILSTHVTIFKTLFGNQKSDLFAFHQLCNSIIVMDEIQNYNNKIWSQMISFLKGYAQLLNIKVIIMSATLPDLEILTQNKGDTIKLILDRKKYFEHPKFSKRVITDYSLLDKKITLDELVDHVCAHRDYTKKILIEFITKKNAYEFFDKIKGKTKRVVKLMTGDNSIHERKQLIKSLEEISGIILVATQVIEAGVDIDMDIGYKDSSKLDSEEQFMGRINRSGKKEGIVYFFDIDNERNIYKNDFRTERDMTLKNPEMRKILAQKNYDSYYGKILSVMKLNIEKENDENIQKFFCDYVAVLDFAKMKESLKLIEDKNEIVSVFLPRVIKLEDGTTLDGHKIWEEYTELLEDNEMAYAEKTVKIFDIKTKMNNFIYQVNKDREICYDERIGDIFYIKNAEEYFEEGMFNRKKFESQIELFL